MNELFMKEIRLTWGGFTVCELVSTKKRKEWL
jgi:hypothetical protein